MCGVAAQTRRALDWFIPKSKAEKIWDGELADSYNIRPTDPAFIVTETDKGKVLDMMKFGLIPSFANTDKMEFATFNAKVETIEQLASYKTPFKKHQFGIMVVDGYFEFLKQDKERIPFYFTLKNGEPMLLACLYEVNTRASDKPIKSFTIITVSSNEVVGEIHDKKRMPAQLSFEDAMEWLNPDTEPERAKELLITFPDEPMQRFMVSKMVNNSRSAGSDLILPLESPLNSL